MELGDAEGAVRAFEALLAVNPRNAAGWFNLGYIHDQHERNAEAGHCFRTALDSDPKLDRAWYGLGLVLVRQGRLDEAVAAFKRNTALQPFSPYGWYQLAMTLHHLGRGAEARRVNAELRRIEPRFAAALERDLAQTQPLRANAPASAPEEPSAAAAAAATA
jgi:tetratricopeptide (TPR) repeat protein